MKRIAPLLLAGLLAAPAQAQNDNLTEGADLLERGMRLLFEGLMEEMSPHLDELEGALSDLSGYYPPEILPNGDILIRRKVPLQAEPEIGEDGETEL